MVNKRSCAPATKEDLAELSKIAKENLAELGKDLAELRQATKEDLSNLGAAIRAEMAAKADLKEEIGSVRRDLGLAVLETHKRIDHLEVGLRTEMREGNSRVLQAIDAFTGKVQNSERAMLFHGQELTATHIGLKDHERRIAALEARPGS